ncbi:MAG: reductive dehalogenase [Anaerolineales bacterium]|nr:reductive dehalogenase [Anaerolineales bacterium]
MSEEKQEKSKLDRRSFLKLGAIGAFTSIAAGSTKLLDGEKLEKGSSSASVSLFKKEYDTIDDMIEISPDYKRFDQRNIMFARGAWDVESGFGGPEGAFSAFIGKQLGMIPTDHQGAGYSKIDLALSIASWGVHDTGAFLSSAGVRNAGVLQDWERFTNPQLSPYEFQSAEEATKYVKKATTFLGASLVGIAPFDERWVYEKWYNLIPLLLEGGPEVHEDAVMPFQPKSVIVMAFEMDYDAFRCAPSHIEGAGAGKQYSSIAETGHKVAIFLNSLGYKAIPCGNDTALSIPIAIQAGLGELGRNNVLITEEFGPRVRLGKVFTNLELVPDKPKSFGATEFCKVCFKCADACPVDALSRIKEPSTEPTVDSISSSPGVAKWWHDNEKCLGYWAEQGSDCGACIASCPYNKLDGWHHDIARVIAEAPGGRDIARTLDDVFGYGDTFDPNAAEEFWNS